MLSEVVFFVWLYLIVILQSIQESRIFNIHYGYMASEDL